VKFEEKDFATKHSHGRSMTAARSKQIDMHAFSISLARLVSFQLGRLVSVRGRLHVPRISSCRNSYGHFILFYFLKSHFILFYFVWEMADHIDGLTTEASLFRANPI